MRADPIVQPPIAEQHRRAAFERPARRAEAAAIGTVVWMTRRTPDRKPSARHLATPRT